jgi:hypothetical protein
VWRSRTLLAAAAATALAAGVAITSTPSVAAAGCSRATARTAIARVKPHVPGLGGSPVLVTPSMVDETICFDFTRDGLTDLAVTIASGGTAGDVGWLVLRATHAAPGWRLALARSGYKLGIFRVGGDVVSSQPVYRKNDPNCCPTGGFYHQSWHWNGSRFVPVRSWRSGSFRP